MKISVWIKSGLLLSLILSISACQKQSNIATASHDKAKTSQAKSENTSLSKLAQQGQQNFAVCQTCHNPELDPYLAPPMYGVQKHYKRAYPDKQEFVKAMVDFAQNPSEEKAVMKRPVAKLGLMPAQTLSEKELFNIATYIYEEKFPPPCKHWEIAVRNAEAKNTVDDPIKKDKMKLN